ncbi:MAG: glycolate oxidase subunit GlcE [Geminicoccaceae bacterium]|nr:glycolate oxidase subunit GlcE [Geminicoccaceae bacterium]MCS7269200.1 glycolate oxidase subunit GlcE [Geminicoccaceae bacterium]MCX7631369.1 glycolate oxidase subunit GlcE [Geminicoccaceae bacterium]MDW8124139.1 glycolate oxidase subunit GlcE [Geminicoccaceae bacterium]MDW8342691.1 glycolate oxidase subunit GlcE [Geminicoccaceae bacterium]
MRFEPRSEDEAAALLRDLVRAPSPLRIEGGGTRTTIGRPIQTAATLSTRALAGVSLYEPAEMVVSVRTGTPVAELEALLAGKGQMLPFEPPDFRALLGSAGEPTVGGVVAGNLSGPRRIQAGACRDSLIGLRFVNGRGELLRAGGRVMKNVTGLDLVKLLCGSWGTLALLLEATFKVLPRPEASLTLCFAGLSDDEAVALMCAAMGTPFPPSAAAHLPAGAGGARARTLLRLEGFRDSVRYRAERLAASLAGHGAAERIEGQESAELWRAVRDVRPLVEPRERAIWRLSLPPRRGAETVARIRAERSCAVLYDWAGGLVWLATEERDDAGAAPIRAAAAAAGGHAMLVRASPELRARVPPFHPPSARVRALEAGIKKAFDPAGIFNPGLREAGI